MEASSGMATQIQRHEPEGVRQVGMHLPIPGQAALRKTMDEDDGPPAGIARLDRVQPYSAAADNAVVLEHVRTTNAPLRYSTQ